MKFVTLMLVGVVGVRMCEPVHTRPTWVRAAHLISDTLTSAGFGDIVPVSRAARLFITIYSVVGTLVFAQVVGCIALQPLEAERRAAQRKVLGAYGTTLTEQSLARLARGPLVKRLGLSKSDDLCSRSEFMLLLLVQQGKVSEEDLVEVRSSFDRLDVDKTGRLSRNDLDMLEAGGGG